MNLAKTRGKLLAIALDGVSASQLDLLASRMPRLKQLLAASAALEIDSGLAAANQAIWAEILTGRDWLDTGCHGFARPLSTLNQLAPVAESWLKQPVSLFPDDGRLGIAANIPLLEPNVRRLWFSDGVAPGSQVSLPSDIAWKMETNSYRGRPFSSTVAAGHTQESAIAACLENDRRRVDLVRSACQEIDWGLCLLRLSTFELVGHLAGHEFLSMQSHRSQPAFTAFLGWLDEQIAQLALYAEQTVIFSCYSFERCLAAANVNRLLERAGLCRLQSSRQLAQDPALKRRLLASGHNTDSLHFTDVRLRLIQRFDLETTSICSPLAAVLYTNPALSCEAAAEAVEKARIYLVREFLARLDGSLSCREAELDAGGSRCQILAIGMSAVDFSSYSDEGIDLVDKPRAVHSGPGFLLVAGNSRLKASPCPVGIHNILVDLQK